MGGACAKPNSPAPEGALRQQTGILQSMLNSMGDGVVVADGQAEIILFNPARGTGWCSAGMGRHFAVNNGRNKLRRILRDTMPA